MSRSWRPGRTMPERLVPVVVTGVGVQAAQACGAAEFEALLWRGQAIPVPGDGSSCVARIEQEPADRLAVLQARGAVPEGTVLPRRAGAALHWAVLAAWEALAAAGGRQVRPDRLGVFLAGERTTAEVVEEMRSAFARRPEAVRPSVVQRLWATDVMAGVAEACDARGECLVVGGASAAGNCALVVAARAITAGACDMAVVVGTLDGLLPALVQGFANVGVLSGPDRPGLPLDRSRHGFVLAEASAAVVLESADHATRRGQPVHARLAGLGIRNDARRGTLPALDGEVGAMRSALAAAGVAPQEVDVVNMHATGTSQGDEVEWAAVQQVFGEGPWLQATKALVGHSLGTASLVEAVASVLQISAQRVHASPVEDPLGPRVATLPQPGPVRHIVSNAFAFGGLSTSLVFSRV